MWDSDAEQTLAELCAMVPDTVRPLAEAAARDESELLASEHGGAVTASDVLRGWIRTTPPDQRNSLVEVVEDLGFDPTIFADDLQSDEGWSEDADSEA